jgi:hypothetical protein
MECIEDLQRPQGGYGVFLVYKKRGSSNHRMGRMRGDDRRTIVMADETTTYNNIPCNNNHRITINQLKQRPINSTRFRVPETGSD